MFKVTLQSPSLRGGHGAATRLKGSTADLVTLLGTPKLETNDATTCTFKLATSPTPSTKALQVIEALSDKLWKNSRGGSILRGC
jgi:hypothetical protein